MGLILGIIFVGFIVAIVFGLVVIMRKRSRMEIRRADIIELPGYKSLTPEEKQDYKAKINIEYQEKMKKRKKENVMVGGLVVTLIVAMVGFIFIPFGFVQVETGEVAVVKTWGEAKGIKYPGLYFRNVISDTYEIYDLKTQEIEIKREVYTKDVQPLTVDLVVQFKIKSEDALSIAKQYGTLATLKSRVHSIVSEKSEVVLTSSTAMELVSNRGQLSPTFHEALKVLETLYYISIENVAIVDMAFSDAFEKAVEQKMIAEQEILKAEADKEKAIIKAKEELAVAMLNAEKKVAEAQGNADAMLALAKAEAESLKIKTIEVARMLGFPIIAVNDSEGLLLGYEIDMTGKSAAEIETISDYIKYLAYLETWDGALPTVVGDGASVYIPMPTK